MPPRAVLLGNAGDQGVGEKDAVSQRADRPMVLTTSKLMRRTESGLTTARHQAITTRRTLEFAQPASLGRVHRPGQHDCAHGEQRGCQSGNAFTMTEKTAAAKTAKVPVTGQPRRDRREPDAEGQGDGGACLPSLRKPAGVHSSAGPSRGR